LATNKLEKNFADLDLLFSPNPITKDVSLKYDVEAVKRSVRHLLFTNRGERLFQPENYCGIRNLLFENYGSVQMVSLRNKIEEVISNYEPRINGLVVDFHPAPDSNYLQIDIKFTVQNSPTVSNMTFDIQRAR
jgi:phage baseplate assembly protein W